MSAENYNELTKEELATQLTVAKRKIDELERSKRRVGLSFRRIPETGYQISRLYDGDFPYLQHIPSLSYNLNDRHVDEKKDNKTVSTATDGNVTLIEGENLVVLTALQLTHRGQIDVIYIDPPYNTGNNDFIYNDARKSSIKDLEGVTLDDYEATLDGKARTIGKDDPERHSLWLSFMEKRLHLAKELLSETGVIFVSIDDNEQARLKLLMDEVFGEQNFVANMVWKKKQGGGNDSSNIVVEHEYIMSYSKTPVFSSLLDSGHIMDVKQYPFKDGGGNYSLIRLDKPSLPYTTSLDFIITDPDGQKYEPRTVNGKRSCWRWGKKKVNEDYDKLVFRNDGVFTKAYLPVDGIKPKSLLIDTRFGRSESGNDDLKSLLGHKVFSYPKPVKLIQHLLRISASPNAIILDFFAGSGTTAHAVAELNKEDSGNRQCILVTHGDENDKNIAEDVTAARIKCVLSGKNWSDGKTHGSLPGELNYYKLAYVSKRGNPLSAVAAMQSKFTGYAALQQDVVVNPDKSTSGYSVLRSSKKIVVLVKNEDYLIEDIDELYELLDELNTNNSNDPDNYKELIVYIPSSGEEDEYDFGSHGWKSISFPVEYIKAHTALVNRMKKNKTLLPVVDNNNGGFDDESL